MKYLEKDYLKTMCGAAVLVELMLWVVVGEEHAEGTLMQHYSFIQETK